MRCTSSDWSLEAMQKGFLRSSNMDVLLTHTHGTGKFLFSEQGAVGNRLHFAFRLHGSVSRGCLGLRRPCPHENVEKVSKKPKPYP